MHSAHTDPSLAQGLELFRTVLTSSACKVDESVQAWRAYADTITACVRSGSLEPQTASAIAIIATNVLNGASARETLEVYSQTELTTLSNQIRDIAITYHESTSLG